jgi:RNA polymerase sigma-70 factor (ECF subfamily)
MQHYKKSLCFVKSYVRNDMAAEDIVSESLINLWQTMKKDVVEHPGALLLTILKNETLNYLKHQTVRQTAMESISLKMQRDLGYRIATLEACDPQEVFSAEITGIVEKTLQALPSQTRCIFEMSRYEHLPVKEIARLLSLSPKSVEYHITQSLKALRIALDEYLPVICFLFYPN